MAGAGKASATSCPSSAQTKKAIAVARLKNKLVAAAAAKQRLGPSVQAVTARLGATPPASVRVRKPEFAMDEEMIRLKEEKMMLQELAKLKSSLEAAATANPAKRKEYEMEYAMACVRAGIRPSVLCERSRGSDAEAF